MQFLRWGQNPWDQRVVLHVSWDLVWLAVAAGLLFIIAHAVYVHRRFASAPHPDPLPAGGEREDAPVTEPPNPDVITAIIPGRIVRHPLAARAFHWGMTLAMVVLFATGFLPVFGFSFAWVTIHWIAGALLAMAVAWHVAHAVAWQDITAMWVTAADRQDARHRLARAVGRPAPAPGKPGKYPIDNKAYHHLVALVTIAIVATGLVMMARVPVPFWARNPYLLSDRAWSVVYVVHGGASIALVALVMAHVYFAIRPEKWWITQSMISGWIGRGEYLQHHDPRRWVVAGVGTDPAPPGRQG